MKFDFTVEDIENFIQIAKLAEEKGGDKSFQKLLEVKERISILNEIDKDELKALVYDVRFRRFKEGEIVIQQDEASQEIFYILKGICHASKENVFLGELQAGETFGEIGVITQTPRSADIKCFSEECLLLSFRIDQENLEFNAPALAILYRNLAKEINEKLQRLNLSLTKRM